MDMINKPIEELDTPAVLIDLDVLERNLQHTTNLAKNANVKFRPHFKTHKSVWIAQEQIRLGACGITVAKLGEAEILVEAGIKEILIAYPLIGKAKLDRLAKLLDKARIIVGIDNMTVAQGLSDLGVSLNRRIELYVDVNTGLGRCGREPGEETAALVREMVKLPGVEVIGLMTHRSTNGVEQSPAGFRIAAKQESEGLVSTQQLLAKEGIHLREISVGTTATSKAIHEQEGVTEMRPGAYVYADAGQLLTGIVTPEECAMNVMVTVVSAPREGVVITDGGSKTYSSDRSGMYPGFGMLRNEDGTYNKDAYVSMLSEEHGNVHVPEGVNLEIGQRVRFLPNHCCVVSNLHNRLYGIRNGKVERIITVDARGKIN